MRVQFMTPHFKSGTCKQVFPRLSSARTKFIEMSDFASFFFFFKHIVAVIWRTPWYHRKKDSFEIRSYFMKQAQWQPKVYYKM